MWPGRACEAQASRRRSGLVWLVELSRTLHRLDSDTESCSQKDNDWPRKPERGRG